MRPIALGQIILVDRGLPKINSMKVRDIVRTAVLRTNPYWPFSMLNKMPYELAITAFGRLCERFPEIRSVYLRHGLTEGSWIPALSDIDLALIIDGKLSVEEQFSFLRLFWEKHDRLKNLFPMLGEIEILNDEHIGLWTQFDVTGYKSISWKLLYGNNTLKGGFPVGQEKLANDSLNYALRFYLGYFHDKFEEKAESTYLTSQDLKRLASKILKTLNYPTIDDSNAQTFVQTLDDKTDMLVRVLIALEEGARKIPPLIEVADSQKNDRAWFGDIDSHNKVVFDSQALDLKALGGWDKAIQSIILNYDKRMFIVLDDELEPSAMKSCIRAMGRIVTQEGTRPVIMSSYLFSYMLRYYDPFEYSRFIGYRIVAFGKDLLSDLKPPTKDSFISCLMRRTPTVLSFPQCHTLISPSSPNWFSRREFDVILNQSLFLKLYLEKGVIKAWHNELLTECQNHYPEHFIEFRELRESPDATAGQEWFRLLKGMANDVHTRLRSRTERNARLS